MHTTADRLRVRVSAHADPEATIIALRGEIDSANIDHLTSYIRGFICTGPALILDLSGVKFIGVAAFRALVAAGEECAQADQQWVLVNSEAMQLLLRASGCEHRLPVVNSLSEALRQIPGTHAGYSLPRVTPRHLTRC
jgi:anti-anti-sigma factor